jgi:DmsE family decaheme c-type cytochrome
MRLLRGIAGNALLAVIVAAGVLLPVSSPVRSQPAAATTDDVCLECHDGLNKTLEPGPHRLGSEYSRPNVVVACVSCHAGAETHVDNPSLETITTPAELSGHEAFVTCTKCHIAHVGLDNYGFDAHSVQEMNCTKCHRVHVEDKPLLLDDRAEYCAACHSETVTAFARVSQHPVMQGNLTCLSCHRVIKRTDNRPGYDLAAVCRGCHPAEAGPFPYEHEAVDGYSVEEGGCIECHNPHGSENDHLLAQPTAHLCRRCHAPVGHVTAHGGIWADYDCLVCHTDIHGSFVSNRFLDPALAARVGGDCFNVGCHALNR